MGLRHVNVESGRSWIESCNKEKNASFRWDLTFVGEILPLQILLQIPPLNYEFSKPNEEVPAKSNASKAECHDVSLTTLTN